jgi:hypothetical protein
LSHLRPVHSGRTSSEEPLRWEHCEVAELRLRRGFRAVVEVEPADLERRKEVGRGATREDRWPGRKRGGYVELRYPGAQLRLPSHARYLAPRSPMTWRRVGLAGVLWAVVYDMVWATAWLAVLRDKWTTAVAAAGRPMPWTLGVWLLWMAISLPIGISIMTHAASNPRGTLKAAVSASPIVALLISGGTTVAFIRESLPADLVVLDGVVNVAGMLLAAWVASLSLRRHRQAEHPASATHVRKRGQSH